MADARISSDEVRAIRASDAPASELAEQYGLHPPFVERIRQRQVYKDIPDIAEATEPPAEETIWTGSAYITYRPYPRMLYDAEGKTRIVASFAEESQALREGWRRHPNTQG